MNNKVAAEFIDVNFKYDKDGPYILKNVNFKLRYSQITLLCGASGCGKSTIFSILNGIIPNSVSGYISGEILVNAENIKGRTIEQQSYVVGSVLQDANSQIIHNTIEEEISFGCENMNMPVNQIEKNIQKYTDNFNLNPTNNTNALSGGQKQSLITASTLAMEQKIVILDESFSNLDKTKSERLIQVLSNLAKEGYAILIIEHKFDMLKSYIDEVWYIDNGEVKSVSDVDLFLKNHNTIIEPSGKCNKVDKVQFDLKNISYKYGKNEVLKDINMQVYKGEKLLILGENGSGKTTLLNIISKVTRPKSGVMTNTVIEKYKTRRKGNFKWYRKISLIYQNPSYQLFMPTVEKEILLSTKDFDYAQYLVNYFDIGKLLNRHPQSLSQGQKRKISIICALACKPEVLILDEPTVGLDTYSLIKLIDILNEISDKFSTTIITITHDIRCVKALCDRAILIENGVAKEVSKNEYFNLN